MTQAIDRQLTEKSVGGGERIASDWERQKSQITEELASLEQELEQLEYGIDVGRADIGGNGMRDYVPLGPSEEDTEFFKMCENDPVLANFFGGVGRSKPEEEAPKPAEKNSARKGGILGGISGLPVFGWLNTLPGVLITALIFTVLGLVCLLAVFSSTGTRRVTVAPTPAAVSLSLPTPTLGLEATITAQAVQLTVAANRPTSAPLPTTLPPTLPPSPTPTFDITLARDGKLAPSSVQATAIGWSKSSILRFVSGGDNPESLIQFPETGQLYHYGSYPGEQPGNVVLIGTWDDVGAAVERLQVNDEIVLTDRKGGTYVYKVLRWSDFEPRPTPTSDPNLTGAVATATALARYGFEPPDYLTDKYDLSLLSLPSAKRSYLTLVSLPKPKKREGNATPEPDTGERRAIRALFISYKPAQPGVQGTPVITTVPNNGFFTPSPTPR
jgi:hypothetical protein